MTKEFVLLSTYSSGTEVLLIPDCKVLSGPTDRGMKGGKRVRVKKAHKTLRVKKEDDPSTTSEYTSQTVRESFMVSRSTGRPPRE